MIGLTQITSVPRSEVNHKNEHILLQVSFNDTDDVNIIGTDGEAAYAIKCRRSIAYPLIYPLIASSEQN